MIKQPWLLKSLFNFSFALYLLSESPICVFNLFAIFNFTFCTLMFFKFFQVSEERAKNKIYFIFISTTPISRKQESLIQFVLGHFIVYSVRAIN